MKKIKKAILGTGVVSAVAATVAAAVSRKISKFVVDAALDREEPKRMKSAKKPDSDALSPEMTEKLTNLRENLRNSECETVEIEAYDGEKLIGHWHECENAKRIIVAMHGWRSAWYKDFCAISDFWKENDCSILYAEQRGQGDSGGDYMGFGMIERYDCKEWVNWINQRIGAEVPIYLAGVSMGAATVLMTSGFELPKNVAGIMADCGFTSAKEIWKHVADESLHISYGVRNKVIEDMCKKKIQVGTYDYTTIDAMKVNKIPVLFVHGTDDTFVPIEMTYANYKACIAPKKLFVVPGATHAMSYMVDKIGYEKTVLDFWREIEE